MGQIYHLPTTNHISAEKCGGFEQSLGFNKVPLAVINAIFNSLRGGDGPDVYAIKLYRNGKNKPGEEIVRGVMPSRYKTNFTLVLEFQEELNSFLDSEVPKAFETIKGMVSRIYYNRHHNCNVVFVKCTNGIIGCGWYDRANSTQKGILTACYLLYTFGSINESHDRILYTATQRYLPFEGSFTLDQAKMAEQILLKYSVEEALNRVGGED